MIVALHHLQLFLHRPEPIFSIHWLHGMRKGWQHSALKNLQAYLSAVVVVPEVEQAY
jgi:hypothetical protein